MNDLDRIRYRQAGKVRNRSQIGAVGSQAQLGQVYDGGAFPTVGQRFALMRPAVILGDEVEGATPTFSVDSTASIPAYFYGTKAPTVGDYHVAHSVSHRWIARSGGACVEDANWVCLPCACPERLPRRFYVGDGNGTHTLLWNGSRWTVTVTITEDVWSRDPFTLECTHSTKTYSYVYTLDACVPLFPGFGYGLAIGFNTIVCGDTEYYGEGSASAQTSYNNRAPFDCTLPIAVNFTLPTTTFGGLAVPGGGGPLTVVS